MEDNYESMDYGIEEYDKRPCYRTRRGSYLPVYRVKGRVERIPRGIGPFIKFLAGITIFLVVIEMVLG